MKLTDERILVLAAEEGLVYRPSYGGCISPYMDDADLTAFVLGFARAILKEAGVEELERKLAGYDTWLSNGIYFTEAEYQEHCQSIRHTEDKLKELEREAKRRDFELLGEYADYLRKAEGLVTPYSFNEYKEVVDLNVDEELAKLNQ